MPAELNNRCGGLLRRTESFGALGWCTQSHSVTQLKQEAGEGLYTRVEAPKRALNRQNSLILAVGTIS